MQGRFSLPVSIGGRRSTVHGNAKMQDRFSLPMSIETSTVDGPQSTEIQVLCWLGTVLMLAFEGIRKVTPPESG
jgi:hypothetical protein